VLEGRRRADKGCVLKVVMVKLEVEFRLEDLDLVEGQVLQSSFESLDSLILSVCVLNECVQDLNLLELGVLDVIEIKAVVNCGG